LFGTLEWMSSQQLSNSQITPTLSLSEKRAKAEALRAQGFAHLAKEIAPVRLGVDRLIPVHNALSSLFNGGGIRRGSVVSVAGDKGAMSLLLSLLQVPASAGSWIALVDTPALGMLAASELGFPLARCISVTVNEEAKWMKVLGVAIGAFEFVVIQPDQHVNPAELRPLFARMREEGSVLVQLSGARGDVIPSDIRLEVHRSEWIGLASGTGRLMNRKIEVKATGKGAAATERFTRFWMPGLEGEIETISEASVRPSDEVIRIRAVS